MQFQVVCRMAAAELSTEHEQPVNFDPIKMVPSVESEQPANFKQACSSHCNLDYLRIGGRQCCLVNFTPIEVVPSVKTSSVSGKKSTIYDFSLVRREYPRAQTCS